MIATICERKASEHSALGSSPSVPRVTETTDTAVGSQPSSAAHSSSVVDAVLC